MNTQVTYIYSWENDSQATSLVPHWTIAILQNVVTYTEMVFLTCVNAVMSFKIIITNKSLFALITFVWLFASVPECMAGQLGWCLERLITAFHFTLVGLLFLMHSAMNPTNQKVWHTYSGRGFNNFFP